MDDANEIERLKAELERVKAEGVEVYWNQEIKRLNAELKRLSLLAESYRGIIREMLETSDVKYTDQSEVFERARAALEIDQK